MKQNTLNNELDIIFFDWTMGKIKNKEKINLQSQIQKIIKNIDYKGKINCKFYYVFPYYNPTQLESFSQQKYYDFDAISKNGEICKIEIKYASFNCNTPFSST